jgi:hypothetical protein
MTGSLTRKSKGLDLVTRVILQICSKNNLVGLGTVPVTYLKAESVFFSRIDSSDSVDDARLRVDDELASSVAGRCVNQRVLNPPIVGPVVVHGLDLPCWKFIKRSHSFRSQSFIVLACVPQMS